MCVHQGITVFAASVACVLNSTSIVPLTAPHVAMAASGPRHRIVSRGMCVVVGVTVKSNGGQCTNEAVIDDDSEGAWWHVVVVVASFIMSSSTHEDS